MNVADYRASQTLNESDKIAGNNSNFLQESQTALHDITLSQFATPLVPMKTVADQCYLRLKSSRDEILQRCRQKEPITFEDMFGNLKIDVTGKIGEGVYGEVFQCAKPDGARSVLKLVPIEGSLLINGEKQKTFDEILSEIIISSELSNLRQRSLQFCTDGFVELASVSCVVGRYPGLLKDLWVAYRDRNGSENDNPESFPDDQHYIAFETAYGGKELDGFRFNNALQSFAVFSQIVLCLAVAEKRFDFEHRDLHTGNILIEPTEDSVRKYCLLGEEIVVQTQGLKASIIDYTLSRIVYNGLCLFNDLSTDEELFTAEGDYQFEIYRKMKTALQNQWNVYSPKTNVFWLHYLIDKLISLRNYRERSSKGHRAAMKSMKELKEVLLDFNSVCDIVHHYFTPDLNESNKEN
uniref:non-specific serine/threonine protein kinase n=1 Tax=Anopheles atroparvus TaxID=41427 RepID=A0A182IPX7_ANOAO